MDVQVLLQAYGMAKCFPTQVTGEGSDATVRPPDVDLQAVGRGEDLVTLYAVVSI